MGPPTALLTGLLTEPLKTKFFYFLDYSVFLLFISTTSTALYQPAITGCQLL
jgi:hypothetical protein